MLSTQLIPASQHRTHNLAPSKVLETKSDSGGDLLLSVPPNSHMNSSSAGGPPSDSGEAVDCLAVSERGARR